MQSWSVMDPDLTARAEILLERSERYLNKGASRDDRAVCLLTLKRAINHRLKAIEATHKFKKMNIPNKPKGYLELLKILGIVRPLLLKKLMSVRGLIEHEDAKPPSLFQCREYADVVWYLLRSTERYVKAKSDDFLFRKLKANGDNTQYWLNFFPKDDCLAMIEVTGWVPKSFLRKKSANPEFLSLEVVEIGTKEEIGFDSKNNTDKLPTDTWVCGHISPSAVQRLILLRKIVKI